MNKPMNKYAAWKLQEDESYWIGWIAGRSKKDAYKNLCNHCKDLPPLYNKRDTMIDEAVKLKKVPELKYTDFDFVPIDKLHTIAEKRNFNLIAMDYFIYENTTSTSLCTALLIKHFPLLERRHPSYEGGTNEVY